MRNLKGLEQLAVFNIHVQNVIQCGQTIFNGSPDKISIPILFESMERINQLMDDIKLQANTSVSTMNAAESTIAQG